MPPYPNQCACPRGGSRLPAGPSDLLTDDATATAALAKMTQRRTQKPALTRSSAATTMTTLETS